MIDEKSRRRKEWTSVATWITLADGQRWAFCKPWLQVHARFEDGKPVETISRTTFGEEFDQATDLIRNTETNHDLIIATMTVGAHLLKLQYDLTDEELESLFVFRFGNEQLTEESMAMVQEIAGVAMGTSGSQSFRAGRD